MNSLEIITQAEEELSKIIKGEMRKEDARVLRIEDGEAYVELADGDAAVITPGAGAVLA